MTAANPVNLSNLYHTTKEAKVHLERLRMENLWIERFLNENSAKPVRSRGSANTKIGMKKKLELCESTIYKFKKKIDKEQEMNIKHVKDLNAHISNLEISVRDFVKIKNEFERNFAFKESQVELKTDEKRKRPYGFLMELNASISTNTSAIRMKVGTIKGDFNSKRGLILKLEDLNNWLSPVDFDLAMFRQRSYQAALEEIMEQSRVLQKDERIVTSKINLLRNSIFEKKNELKHIETKTVACQERIGKLKVRREVTQNAVTELENSIADFQATSKSFSAPTVTNYIGKMAERDKLKAQLKVTKRKIEIAKVANQSLLKNYRQAVRQTKNE